MIKLLSNNIQNAIQRELFKANNSIRIAMAWFTNDLLFQPLLLKLQVGVSVEIIINKDEINCSPDNKIDFGAFINRGGIIRWNESDHLLHEKFCIIDDNVVIHGSYNWTNKAEKINEESITIAEGENNITTFYIDRFKQLQTKYEKDKRVRSVMQSRKRMIGNPEETTKEKACYFSAVQTGYFPAEWLQTKKENILKPCHYKYDFLHFYDSIRTIHFRDDFYLIIARIETDFFFVDHQTLLPIKDVKFTSFKRYDKEDGKYLWIEVMDKWGLYQTIEKRFVIPPLFEESQILNWQPDNNLIRLSVDGIGSIFNLKREVFSF